MKTPRILLSWLLLAIVVTTPACGKKGPPLAPLMIAPARIGDFAARRIGDTVYLKFTIPAATATGVKPADLARVDVYAYTALLPTDIVEWRDMVLLASVPVRRPPEPEPPPKTDKNAKDKNAKEKPPKPPKPPKPREPGEDQGELYTVTETLTPAMTTLTKSSQKPKKVLPWLWPVTTLLEEEPVALPLGGIVPVAQPTRFYVAIGVSHHGAKGAASPIVGVQLTLAPPPAPGAPVLTVAEKAVTLTWDPPPGAPQPPYGVPRPFTELDALGMADAATATAAGTLAAAVAVPATMASAAATLARAMAAAAPKPPAAPAASAATPAAALGAKPAAAPVAAAPAAVPFQRVAAPPAPLTGTPRGMILPVLLGYNVYVVGMPVPPPMPVAPGAPVPAPLPVSAGNAAPLPLNPAPLTTPTFPDPTFEFGTERCYVVRAVNALGLSVVQSANTAPVPGVPAAPAPPKIGPPKPPVVALPPVWFEGPASSKTCVTPKDIFPPPVPASLAAVGSAGAINLIWEGVDAADLAGYVVLRGAAPDGPMTPLFDAPIHETTYRDTAVKSGVRYVYVVVSVDKATPPNRSLPSNKAEETAR